MAGGLVLWAGVTLPLQRAPEWGGVDKPERAQTGACKGGNSCGQGQAGGERAWHGSSQALKGQTSWQCTCFLGGPTGQALLWCRTHPSSPLPGSSPAPGTLQHPAPESASSGFQSGCASKGHLILLPLPPCSLPEIGGPGSHTCSAWGYSCDFYKNHSCH